jgi:pimeloyl-ACP methyl ester carboxylesterase
VPTLILCGREDALCPVERHELMHALIAGLTAGHRGGGGHMPTLERPDVVCGALAAWLAR